MSWNDDLEAEALAAIAVSGLTRFRARDLRAAWPRTPSTVRDTLERLVRKGYLSAESERVSGYRARGGGPWSGLSPITYKSRRWYVARQVSRSGG